MSWLKTFAQKSVPLPGWLIVLLVVGAGPVITGISAYGGDLTRDKDLAGLEPIIEAKVAEVTARAAKAASAEMDTKMDRRFDEHAALEEARWQEVRTLLLETRQDVRELRASQRGGR